MQLLFGKPAQESEFDVEGRREEERHQMLEIRERLFQLTRQVEALDRRQRPRESTK